MKIVEVDGVKRDNVAGEKVLLQHPNQNRTEVVHRLIWVGAKKMSEVFISVDLQLLT